MKVICSSISSNQKVDEQQHPAAVTVKTTVNDGIFAYQLVSQQQ